MLSTDTEVKQREKKDPVKENEKETLQKDEEKIVKELINEEKIEKELINEEKEPIQIQEKDSNIEKKEEPKIQHKKVFGKIEPRKFNLNSPLLPYVITFLLGLFIGILFFEINIHSKELVKEHFSGIKDQTFIQHQMMNLMRDKMFYYATKSENDNKDIPKNIVDGNVPSIFETNEKFESYPQLKNPNRDVFFDFLNLDKPILIIDHMSEKTNWKVNKWTDKYLLENFKKFVIDVELTRGRTYPPKRKDDGQAKVMKLSDFLINYRDPDRSFNYFLRKSFNRYDGIKSLSKDIPVTPEFVPKHWILKDVKFWLSSDTYSHDLRYSKSKKVVCQIFGTRTYYLYPPSSADLLYKQKNSNKVRVDPLSPNFENFPLFKYAKSIKIRIGPGDILFIPSHWFHYEVAEQGKCLSVDYYYENPSNVEKLIQRTSTETYSN